MSPLLLLPPDLRLTVYDTIFSDIVRPHELDEHLYRVPHRWPQRDFLSYTALVGTCRLFRDEMKPLFEKHYLPRIRVHFDAVEQLYRFSNAIHRIMGDGKAAYTKIKFSLRTKPGMQSTYGCMENESIVALMEKVAGYDSLVSQHHVFKDSIKFGEASSISTCCGIEQTTLRKGARQTVFEDRRQYNKSSLVLVAHKVKAISCSRYFELLGEVRMFDWKQVGYADGPGPWTNMRETAEIHEGRLNAPERYPRVQKSSGRTSSF